MLLGINPSSVELESAEGEFQHCTSRAPLIYNDNVVLSRHKHHQDLERMDKEFDDELDDEIDGGDADDDDEIDDDGKHGNGGAG